jgi:hypothetical protein
LTEKIETEEARVGVTSYFMGWEGRVLQHTPAPDEGRRSFGGTCAGLGAFDSCRRRQR